MLKLRRGGIRTLGSYFNASIRQHLRRSRAQVPSTTQPPVVVAICIAFSLAACQTNPAVREVTVTREIPTPYAAPCPKPEDKPVRPTRVSQDHPVMPTDPGEQARILAAKLLEWLTYGEAADGIMSACSRP